jgi:hypothetical protein
MTVPHTPLSGKVAEEPVGRLSLPRQCRQHMGIAGVLYALDVQSTGWSQLRSRLNTVTQLFVNTVLFLYLCYILSLFC